MSKPYVWRATRRVAVLTTLVMSGCFAVSGVAGATTHSLSSRAVAFDTSFTVPGAPSDVTVAADVNQITVQWSAPSDTGGDTITAYVVQYSSDGGTTWTTDSSCSDTTTSCVISSLNPGTTYTAEVAATNPEGTGDYAVAAESATTPNRPDAPTNLLASAGDHSLTFSWDQPADNGSTVTSYTVTDGGSDSCTSSSATDLHCTITNLTNGVAHVFSVTATNAVGASDASSTVTAAAYTTPDAPTNIAVNRVVGDISVSWQAPAANGSAITAYTVTATTAGGDPLTCSPDDVTTLTCDLGTPDDYATYAITVTATNDAGGTTSTPVTSVGYQDPGAPSNVQLTAGNGTLAVTFTPGSGGGLPITGYVYSLDGGTTSSPLTLVSGAYVITGLTNGHAYAVQVAAVTALSTGAFTTAVSATPATVPSAPVYLHGTRANGAAVLAWYVPKSTGGAAITSYLVTDGAGHSCTATAPVTTCTVSGLTNGTYYTFTVVARNVMGASVASNTDKVQPATLPGAPVLSLPVASSHRVTVKITAPTNTGGVALAHYDYSIDGGVTWVNATYAVSASTVTFGTLQNGKAYHLAVRATNVVGAGPASNVITATPFTTPDAPVIALITVNKAKVATITVVLPATNGSPLTHLQYSLDKGHTWATVAVSTRITVPVALAPLAYAVVVRAQNAAGFSAVSAPWRLVVGP